MNGNDSTAIDYPAYEWKRGMTQPYYPPQQPAMPQYPTQTQYPQQPYPGTQMQPPPQQFAYPQQQMYPQPAPQPLAQGTLSDFFNQPSTGGGPVFSWKGKPTGTTYAGIVSRQITDGDIQQQTMPNSNTPAFYRDGRKKFLMKVPLTVTPTPEFPDGQAQWWVSGSARDELARAMSEAGCGTNTVPEPGAAIVITLTGERPSGPGMNPSKTYRIQYRRPVGTAAVTPTQQPPTEWQSVPDAVKQQPVPATYANGTVSVQTQPLPNQQVMAPPLPQQVPVTQPPQQPVAQSVQQQTSDLTPEQQQLLASLT